MRKKALLVLLATMTLTLASVGTVFAYEDNGDVASQSETEEHTHTWGEDKYVVDKAAVAPEQKWVVDKEAVYEQIWVGDVETVVVEFEELEYMTGEYKKLLEGVEVTDWLQEGAFICRNCGYEVRSADPDVVLEGKRAHFRDDGFTVCGNTNWTDWRYHTVTGTKVSDVNGHYENGDIISEEEGHWEDVEGTGSPEIGHYEHTCTVCGEIQNRDTGEVIQQGALSGQPTEPVVPNDPNTPQDTPENNVTDDPNTPQTTPDNTPNTEPNVTEPSTSQGQGSNNTTTGNTTGAAAVNTSESKKSPKTGDGTGTMSLLTLVGGALTGGTALAFRKRLAK